MINHKYQGERCYMCPWVIHTKNYIYLLFSSFKNQNLDNAFNFINELTHLGNPPVSFEEWMCPVNI